MSTSPGTDPYGSSHQPPVTPYHFPSTPTPEPEPYRPPRQPRIQPYQPPQAPSPQANPRGGGQGGNGGGRRSQTPSGFVRPYTMTGGRTRPRYQLAIEALVSTTADPERLRGQLPEHQDRKSVV